MRRIFFPKDLWSSTDSIDCGSLTHLPDSVDQGTVGRWLYASTPGNKILVALQDFFTLSNS